MGVFFFCKIMFLAFVMRQNVTPFPLAHSCSKTTMPNATTMHVDFYEDSIKEEELLLNDNKEGHCEKQVLFINFDKVAIFQILSLRIGF